MIDGDSRKLLTIAFYKGAAGAGPQGIANRRDATSTAWNGTTSFAWG